MASRTVARPRTDFTRVFQDALRAVAQSVDAAIAARTMRARVEQKRMRALRTIDETRTAMTRSRAILRDLP